MAEPAGDRWDIAVIGAGAAGLLAAIRAAELGGRVVVLEKNRRAGVKILMSGGTRCNITNARGLRDLNVVSGPIDPAFDRRECVGARAIMQAFGVRGGFLRRALQAFSVERSVGLFEEEGVATKVEANGKVFPVSDRALDVLAALERRVARAGAVVRLNSGLSAIKHGPDGYALEVPDASITSKRLILAVGGQSYPRCGTTGDGYAFARQFGHTIVEPRPALVPLRAEADWVRELKGITLADVGVAVLNEEGSMLAQRREAVLFAHFGLTGPAILDVSREVARAAHPDQMRVRLDFCPGVTPEALDAELAGLCRTGRSSVAAILVRWVPRRLADVLLVRSEIPVDRVGPELSRVERRLLVGALKGTHLALEGSLGFEKAEVTSGGVSLDQVDPGTLESRLQPGLFLAGEVLDLDGLIGGYNFQAGWSTGWLAGESAAKSLDVGG